MAEIRNARHIVSQIKKKDKKQSLVLKINKESLHDLKKLKRTKKIRKSVKNLKKTFKKITGIKLRYVMLPFGAPEKIVDAFTRYGVSVVSKARKVTKVKGADVTTFNGVVLVDNRANKNKKDDFAKLKKALKKADLSSTPLRKCIPVGSSARKAAATDSEAENTEADPRMGFEKSAAMKSETEAEQTEAENTETATESTTKTEDKQVKAASEGNSASSIVVSSVISVAAIASIAAFLL